MLDLRYLAVGAIIQPRPERPCVRCGLFAQLDRAGYCRYCQHEMATGRVYIDWQRFSGLWSRRGWTWNAR